MFRNGIRLYNKDLNKLFSNVCGELYKYILRQAEKNEKKEREIKKERQRGKEKGREREVMRG